MGVELETSIACPCVQAEGRHATSKASPARLSAPLVSARLCSPALQPFPRPVHGPFKGMLGIQSSAFELPSVLRSHAMVTFLFS